MSGGKSPAFQFYPKDFMGDMNVALMSLEERGAYITLMCFCWNEGELPADITRLSRLCGVSVDDMESLWEQVGPCFEEKDGALVHPRLEREREKQQKRSNQARRAARKRWDEEGESGSNADAHADASPDAVQTESPAVCSLQSSTAFTEKEKTVTPSPISKLWPIWVEELGGDPPQPSLTEKRKAKLQALWDEHLKHDEDPHRLFRTILQCIKASDHHMSQRSYQMPESTFRNKERRERWALDAQNPHPTLSEGDRKIMRRRSDIEGVDLSRIVA